MVDFQKKGVAYLGTMGWSYKFWAGKLYADETHPKDYLSEYSKSMNSVEVDSTFYRIPSISVVVSWRDSVPPEFRFTAKFPRSVTHASGLAFNAEKLSVFLKHIEFLGVRLGVLLLQFPPYLNPAHVALSDLLDAVPKRFQVAAEFRNRGWFTDETYRIIRDRGAVVARTNKMKVPDLPETSFAYYRWEGDRGIVNGEKGMVEVDRNLEVGSEVVNIQKYLDSGRSVYGYFSKYYSGYPPSDVDFLRQRLR